MKASWAVFRTSFFFSCLLFTACSVPPRYLHLGGNGKLAVVSFYLDKSIVEDGSERDTGPGMLQKAGNYFEHHQVAVELMWAQAKDSLPAVLGIPDIVPLETVHSNAKYAELTSYPPIKLMGLSKKLGDGSLYPKGFQYVSPNNEKVVNGLFDPLGAEYLLV